VRRRKGGAAADDAHKCAAPVGAAGNDIDGERSGLDAVTIEIPVEVWVGFTERMRIGVSVTRQGGRMYVRGGQEVWRWGRMLAKVSKGQDVTEMVVTGVARVC